MFFSLNHAHTLHITIEGIGKLVLVAQFFFLLLLCVRLIKSPDGVCARALVRSSWHDFMHSTK